MSIVAIVGKKDRWSNENTKNKRSVADQVHLRIPGPYNVVVGLPATRGPKDFEERHPGERYVGYEWDLEVYEQEKSKYLGLPNWAYINGDIFDFAKDIDSYLKGDNTSILFIPDLQRNGDKVPLLLLRFSKQIRGKKIGKLDIFVSHSTRKQEVGFSEAWELINCEQRFLDFGWVLASQVQRCSWSDGSSMEGALIQLIPRQTGFSPCVLVSNVSNKKQSRPRKGNSIIRTVVSALGDNTQLISARGSRKAIALDIQKTLEKEGRTVPLGSILARISELANKLYPKKDTPLLPGF